MIKRICDICGKEIDSRENDWNVSIMPEVAFRNFRYDEKDYSFNGNDVCSDCANSIYHHIEGLKRLIDKSTES